MENYLANVIPHLQQWWPVIVTLSYLIGISFAVLSAVQAISQKHRFDRTVAAWSFTCAVLLLNLPAFMDTLSMSIFDKSSEHILSYSPSASPASIYVQFAVYCIAIIGLIGIVRGLCLLRDTPNQSKNFSRAFVHMIGGIIAVNLVEFLRGIGATLGGDVQSHINTILG